MITSNTSIPFIKAENSENKFYLSRLTSEYNEGDSITTSTAINCRKLAIAIKAGDKITINGTSLTVYADAAVDATSFFVEAITLDEALNINANIAIDEDNMFVQYQRKTEGTVAGFDIDADGMSKGGVEITGWLDSDTMEGATENNIPTAQSVKAYVDGQVGASDTLQEVTDNGNTTTNSIMIGSSSSPEAKLHLQNSAGGSLGYLKVTDVTYGGDVRFGMQDGINNNAILGTFTNNSIQIYSNSTEKMRIKSDGNVGIGTTSPEGTVNIVSTLNAESNLNDGANYHLHLHNPGNDTGESIALGFGITDTVDGIGASIGHERKGSTSYGDLWFATRASGGNVTERMRITSAGKVGIGTTNPSQLFEINGGSGQLITTDSHQRLFITSSPLHQAILYFGDTDSSSQGRVAYDNNYDDMYFNTAGAERMRIKSNGNVGIGTSSDSGYKLDVNGTQRVQDVLELEDVLTLNAISTPDDPAVGKSSIYMDSADGAIKVKINFGEEGVVTRTIASYDG